MKTRKTEINNEIVSLRQFVRQARIRVVNKLTREAKKLRGSHGDEKQAKRNRSKAEKLLREVFALKQIKDDEISKFGIVRFNEIQAILQDPLSDDGTRAMVKIVRYKSLNPRISALRDRFPDCEELVSLDKKGPGNKKKNSITDGSKKSLKRANVDDAGEKVQIVKDVERDTGTDDDDVQDSSQKKNKIDRGKGGQEIKQNVKNSAKKLEVPETGTESKKPSSVIVPKIISKEATVKRFTEILEETSEQGDGRETLEERNGCRITEEEENNIPMDEVSDKAEEALMEPDDFFLNSDKMIPRSNPEEKYTDVSYDKPYPMSKRKRSYDGKESYNERRDNGRSRDVHRDRNKAREANGARKQNRKTAANEEWKSGAKNTNEKNENLHPSWAAKKKQQDILKQGFQGKKIKFDE